VGFTWFYIHQAKPNASDQEYLESTCVEKTEKTLPWCCKKISHPKNFHHADQPSANAHLEFAPRFSQRRSKGIEVIVVTSIILASEHRLHRLHLEMPRRHSPFAAKRLFEDV
jgi:hypothetical protein